MYSASLRFEALVLRARASARADLIWLLEFLTPQFAPTRTRRADWTVTLRTATRTFRAVTARFEASDSVQPVVSFALDTRTLKARSLPAGGGASTLLDDTYAVAYAIDRERRVITILTPSGNRANARIAFMRVVRELAMNESAARGGLLFHGGAFRRGGDIVIVSGPKGSGKTTSLLQAISETGVRYVSNDRMLVAERNGRLCCRGIPTIVTIRASSLRSAPRLAARLPRSGYECFLTRREALRRAPSRTRRRHRYAISPSQLCDLAGTTAWPGGTVAAILFPVIRPREGGARLRELGAVAARRRIRTGLFRAGLPPIRDAAFGPASRPRSARGTLARAVANRVPCFELELGRGARADRSWIARLGALIGPRGTRARGAVR